eukprot:TRINITY_DN5710_c0_g1_i12.p1 TRINITY_DN5710_c0_g1~~TRINITY_DN5710_c0_g1_i12.p1  ORF type:complete len:144 (+),score=17.54 TRINITY_DN5710_c0_g1_i12:510-941(+)
MIQVDNLKPRHPSLLLKSGDTIHILQGVFFLTTFACNTFREQRNNVVGRSLVSSLKQELPQSFSIIGLLPKMFHNFLSVVNRERFEQDVGRLTLPVQELNLLISGKRIPEGHGRLSDVDSNLFVLMDHVRLFFGQSNISTRFL